MTKYSYSAENHADTVGALCGRFQTQSRIVWALIALVAILIIALVRIAAEKTIHVYEVQADGDVRFHGTLQDMGTAAPSKREAEFVGRRFASMLLERNSSTVAKNMSEAVEMCSEQMRAEVPVRWGIQDVIKQIESEHVRTNLSWGHAAVTVNDSMYRARLIGTQAFYPIEQPGGAAWGTKTFDVAVLMKRRPRDPISFPSGLEVVDFVLMGENTREQEEGTK